jgi:CRP-like cAMP-binding protein
LRALPRIGALDSESDVIDPFLTKLRARDELSAEEEAAVRGVLAEVRSYPADKVVIEAGVELHASTLLLDGIMCRYKDLSEGQRQITAIHVAGDFLDLHGFTLKRLEHGVMTLTPCRVALAPHDRLREITERFPHLTRVLWFSTNLDACIHREWEVSLGRRNAVARAAHLLCELHLRLAVVGLADETGYALPITQIELAECLGLTSVHVNRVLRDLRERGLAEFSKGRVTFRDLPGLREVADFDSNYLYLEKRRDR